MISRTRQPFPTQFSHTFHSLHFSFFVFFGVNSISARVLSLVFLLLNWIMWFSSLLITIKIRRFYSLIIEMSFHPLRVRAVAVAEQVNELSSMATRTMENSILDFRYFSTLFFYTSVLALGFFLILNFLRFFLSHLVLWRSRQMKWFKFNYGNLVQWKTEMVCNQIIEMTEENFHFFFLFLDIILLLIKA